MINVEKLNICVTSLIYASKSFLCQNSALKDKTNLILTYSRSNTLFLKVTFSKYLPIDTASFQKLESSTTLSHARRFVVFTWHIEQVFKDRLISVEFPQKSVCFILLYIKLLLETSLFEKYLRSFAGYVLRKACRVSR